MMCSIPRQKIQKTTNILFQISSVGISGAEIVVLNVIKYLNREKFMPFVYCHVKNIRLIERLRRLKVEYRTTSKFPELKKIGRPGLKFSKIFAYIRSISGICFELIPLIKQKKIDIVYANAYPDCLYCIFPAAIMRVPLVWHVHNIRKIHWMNSFLYRIAGALSRKIITVSNACKLNLLKTKINPSKFVTIYNGIDLERFQREESRKDIRKELKIDSKTKLVGFFGQPIPEKGHVYFIEAAAEVVKIFPDSKFLIVGYLHDSEYQNELYKNVNRLKIQNHIIFTGWRDDIPDIMASIDVMAHARTTPEPAGLVLIEAMAMGKPVVTSGTGGIPELVENGVTGIIVSPEDSEALASGIITLLQNPQKAGNMGLEGRKRVEERFSLDRQIKEIEELLTGIRELK